MAKDWGQVRLWLLSNPSNCWSSHDARGRLSDCLKGPWNWCGQGPALSVPDLEESDGNFAHLAPSVEEGTTVVDMYLSTRGYNVCEILTHVRTSPHHLGVPQTLHLDSVVLLALEFTSFQECSKLSSQLSVN